MSSIFSGTSLPFTDRFDNALAFASGLHRMQQRKNTLGTPYIGHLLAVASIVIEAGGSEDQAIAALLHDAIEDQGGQAMRDEIAERFGEAVAVLVEACTDADVIPKPPWRARKEAFIASLPNLPADARLIVLADKIHNAESTLTDLKAEGVSVWDRFRGGRDGTIWYHEALASHFAAAMPGPLAERLRTAVAGMEAF